ncbi:unnamed protein product [Musa acuminata subsp. malaccensis]|uniref:(wild Malaysian banana) hypothetical protein n=1 Tax=Musa acuminata subsp. malaccensis TaxID=214687 RepID=A0A804IM61_MUSAM|nr:PREDICTED: uncharacterized protein LOC103980872 [Musa acuminata subsp. malaccensis]CAG1841491.1 unnamed protein product [Musa acuminata subsp. malaccensis]
MATHLFLAFPSALRGGRLLRPERPSLYRLREPTTPTCRRHCKDSSSMWPLQLLVPAGYTGQTPSALQYFCCHKLRGINCCLSTEVGEVQSPQLMVASGIADTNISRPYLARSPGGDLKFAATSSLQKEDMSRMARLPRSTLEFASRSLVEGKADECADCRDGTIDNESDVKTPPADNHSKDSPSSGGEGSPPAASPEGASGPAAP